MLQTQTKTFGLSKVPPKQAAPVSMINNDYTPLTMKQGSELSQPTQQEGSQAQQKAQAVLSFVHENMHMVN